MEPPNGREEAGYDVFYDSRISLAPDSSATLEMFRSGLVALLGKSYCLAAPVDVVSRHSRVSFRSHSRCRIGGTAELQLLGRLPDELFRVSWRGARSWQKKLHATLDREFSGSPNSNTCHAVQD